MTINALKSFVVTWYNARTINDANVSSFILDIEFQMRHSKTTSNIDDLMAKFP